MNKLLKELSDKNNRKAHNLKPIALNYKGTQIYLQELPRDHYVPKKIGYRRIWLRPIFQPEEFTETFAELSDTIK
jgi:XTP/dITP diphosphohydrolase